MEWRRFMQCLLIIPLCSFAFGFGLYMHTDPLVPDRLNTSIVAGLFIFILSAAPLALIVGGWLLVGRWEFRRVTRTSNRVDDKQLLGN